MDASIDRHSPLTLNGAGRCTRIALQAPAGEIEARLTEMGNWELRIRRDHDKAWRLACTGDLECGVHTAQPVVSVAEEAIHRGPLTIDPASRRVTLEGNDIELTRKEFSLLLVLASHPGRVYTKHELVKTVWGGIGNVRSVDSTASKVRRKLAAADGGSFVINLWGVGYRLWDRPA